MNLPDILQIFSLVVSGVAAGATFWYALLVRKTLVEMVAQRSEMAEQRTEMQQQRLDSLRPAVVPVGPSDRIDYLNSVYDGREDGRQLTLRNVGPGPAFNVAVAIGIRHENGTLEREAQLRDFFTGVPDMASGELGTAVQWTDTNGVKIDHGHVLTIVYDSIHGQHFRTTCHRKSANWLAGEIEQIEQRTPRIHWDARTGL